MVVRASLLQPWLMLVLGEPWRALLTSSLQRQIGLSGSAGDKQGCAQCLMSKHSCCTATLFKRIILLVSIKKKFSK